MPGALARQIHSFPASHTRTENVIVVEAVARLAGKASSVSATSESLSKGFLSTLLGGGGRPLLCGSAPLVASLAALRCTS